MISKFSTFLVAVLIFGCALDADAQGRGGGGFGGGGGGFGGGGGGALGGGGRGGAAGAAQYPAPGQLGQALITSYPDTKQLVVVTDADTAAQMKSVIEQLDRPVPQVLIKVVFLEATYREGLDIGLEGGMRGAANNNTITASNLFGLVQQGANPLIPYTTMPGAGIYSMFGKDFQVTLRAIAEGGKLEVLSRPSILARNNQIATISVGQSVPLITGVSLLGTGINAIPTSNIEYTDIGIILNVTPFITSDGMVEMIVQPEISALSGQSIPISSGVGGVIAAPIIDTRRADTVVVTPDGQTVVIGGLIQNGKNSTETKIPFLGDIPVIGNLFKHKVKGTIKSELMIFLTPHIVYKKDQLAAMSQRETDQTSMHQAFPEAELHRFLDGLPVKPDEPVKIPETKPKSTGSKSNGKR